MLKSKIEKQQIQKIEKSVLLDKATCKREITEITEIRPRYIVADTNCFIDYLDHINIIINEPSFVLILPLLVLNELEKLAKPIHALNNELSESAKLLKKNAEQSLDYIQRKFKESPKKIKAITSQGSPKFKISLYLKTNSILNFWYRFIT